MRLLATERFRRDYRRLSEDIRDQTDRKLEVFFLSPRHPSLQVKKMQGTAHIWELRISLSYRLTFQIQDDLYILRRIGTHDILRKP